MKDIFEHIEKAKRQAFEQYIEANKIIIDKDIAITNQLFIPFDGVIYQVPPMIMGLAVSYDENLKRDYNCNFIVTRVDNVMPKTPLSEYSTEELLEEIKHRIEGEIDDHQ